MGILRISNDLHLCNPVLVNQCLDWLKVNHSAVIHSKRAERHDVVYEITGEEIPEGRFDLVIKEIVDKVYTIRIAC